MQFPYRNMYQLCIFICVCVMGHVTPLKPINSMFIPEMGLPNQPLLCPDGFCGDKPHIFCCENKSDPRFSGISQFVLESSVSLLMVLIPAFLLCTIAYTLYIFITDPKPARVQESQRENTDNTDVSVGDLDEPVQQPRAPTLEPFVFVRTPPPYTENDGNTTKPPAYIDIVVLPATDLKVEGDKLQGDQSEESGIIGAHIPSASSVRPYREAITNFVPDSPPPVYEVRRRSWSSVTSSDSACPGDDIREGEDDLGDDDEEVSCTPDEQSSEQS